MTKTFTLAAGLMAVSLAVGAQQARTEGFQTIPLDNMSAFAPTAKNWFLASAVKADRNVKHDLQAKPGTGILVNKNTDKERGNLQTALSHGDIDLDLDVMVPRGSNSGIYLQGRYEVQLLDSWGVVNPAHSDMGGIYQRWDDKAAASPVDMRGYEGKAPLLNAAKAPGLWQHLHIEFQAPRFDASGKKIANARFLRVELNGSVIHNNVEVSGPTRGAVAEAEVASAPLLIQGDHGPVAFRNIQYRVYDEQAPVLKHGNYAVYKGAYKTLNAWLGQQPEVQGQADNLSWQLSPVSDDFALIYKGSLSAQKSGEATLMFGAEGKARVLVNNKVVLDTNGSWKWWTQKEATVNLNQGENPIEIIYFKSAPKYKAGLQLALKSNRYRRVAYQALSSVPEQVPPTQIMLETKAEPVLQRCFLKHNDKVLPYALVVGHHQGPHYAYNLHTGALIKGWRGPVANMNGMWHERGSDQILRPGSEGASFADDPVVAAIEGNAWPDTISTGFRFRRYQLDAQGYPTIVYESKGLTVHDKITPLENGKGLQRTLTIEGALANQFVRLGSAKSVEALAEGNYLLNGPDHYLEYAAAKGAPKPEVKNLNGRNELVLPLSSFGNKATVSYNIIW